MKKRFLALLAGIVLSLAPAGIAWASHGGSCAPGSSHWEHDSQGKPVEKQNEFFHEYNEDAGMHLYADGDPGGSGYIGFADTTGSAYLEASGDFNSGTFIVHGQWRDEDLEGKFGVEGEEPSTCTA